MDKLKELRQLHLLSVAQQLHDFEHQLIIIRTYGLIALVWLYELLKILEKSITKIQILSEHPANWEGSFCTKNAKTLCDQVNELQTTHFTFFQQELVAKYGSRTLKEYSDAAETIFGKALSQLFVGKQPTHRLIREW